MAAPPDSTDEQLACAARAGRAGAFAELVRRHERALFRFLRMRTAGSHDAEELLQEVFLRGWSNLDRYDAARPFSTWLYTLAARLAASRGRRRRLAAATGRDLSQLAAAGGAGESAGVAEGVWDVAARVLGPEPRSALWLFYAEGRSAREIAVILGKREGAVRVMLHRARSALAPHLQPLVGPRYAGPCSER